MSDQRSADQGVNRTSNRTCKLSEQLKSLMWELGPSRYVLMRELILSAENMEIERAASCKFPGYCKCCGTEGAL